MRLRIEAVRYESDSCLLTCCLRVQGPAPPRPAVVSSKLEIPIDYLACCGTGPSMTIPNNLIEVSDVQVNAANLHFVMTLKAQPFRLVKPRLVYNPEGAWFVKPGHYGLIASSVVELGDCLGLDDPDEFMRALELLEDRHLVADLEEGFLLVDYSNEGGAA